MSVWRSLVLGGLVGVGAAGALAGASLTSVRALPQRPTLVLSDACEVSVKLAREAAVRAAVEEGRWSVRVVDAVEGPGMALCARQFGMETLGRRICLALSEEVDAALSSAVPGAPVPVLLLPGGEAIVGADEILARSSAPAI